MSTRLDDYEESVAGAIISVDTIWGGDVNNRSGTGRVIADSYYSGKDLPWCYDGEDAASLRKSGGASARIPDKETIRKYIARVKPMSLVDEMERHAQGFEPLRREMVLGLAEALRVEFDLALERIGDGPPVPYDRCVRASTGQMAEAVDTRAEREQVRELLGKLGERVSPGDSGIIDAVDAYRKRTWVGHEGIKAASDRVIIELSALVDRNFAIHLPEHLRGVPRANVTFHLIEDAWFSGSMNYIGRARKPDGTPEYEAEYEINAKIEKSQAEFVHLVAHEVVPGHVTTFALIQHLFYIGQAGFESTILTMNTRHSTLFEGIANTGLLLAHGVRTRDELPTPALQLGMLLAQLEDAAKNNASVFTYVDRMPAQEIKRRLRSECLATPERANKLTDVWAQHPLMGRAYMPSYQFGTDLVLELLRKHGPAKMIPILFQAGGVCDCVTIRHLEPAS